MGLLAGEEAGLQVLADSAYGSGEVRAALGKASHRDHQADPLHPTVPGGFTLDEFTIDAAAGLVTCPQGLIAPITACGNAVFGPRCRGCPLRDRCTRSKKGRTTKVHPHHDLLLAARRASRTEQFRHSYQQHRPMVERSIAWLVARGQRRVRYRGLVRNQLGLSHRVAAINLRRLVNLGLDHDGGWVLAT